jgi:hypothetical protein
MNIRIAATLAALMVSATGASSTTASAATIFLEAVTVGENLQTYELESGNSLTLWRINNTRATTEVIDDLSELTAGLVAIDFLPFSVSPMLNAYNGPDPLNAGAAEFSAVSFAFTLPARTSRTFWVEWSGDWLIYSVVGTQQVVVPPTATVLGDPLTPIPVPAALPLLLGGLGALGLAARRRKAA